MTIIVIRSVLFYLALLFVMKLMGKRQIGEMQIEELVTTVLLSELAVLPIAETDIPLIHGLIPLLMIASFEVIISYISQKNRNFRVLLNGNPIVLYENGSYIDVNLTKARVSTEDVEAQVRINGYNNLTQVSCVILERTGKMSILPKEDPNTNQNGE